MLTELITLGTQDKYGDFLPRFVCRCLVDNVTRSEFYEASRADLRVDYVVLVHRIEYENDDVAEFRGKRYTVLRTYNRQFDGLPMTELVLQERLADYE